MNGELWEMKNLTNCASSVSNQIKRARIKWFKLGLSSPSRCVFTNEGNEDGFDETCVALEKRRRPGEVFIVVSNSGAVRVWTTNKAAAVSRFEGRGVPQLY